MNMLETKHRIAGFASARGGFHCMSQHMGETLSLCAHVGGHVARMRMPAGKGMHGHMANWWPVCQSLHNVSTTLSYSRAVPIVGLEADFQKKAAAELQLKSEL